MFSLISNFFKRRFELWLSRRIPAAASHKLTSKNIFIFPSAFGFAYLFFILLLFLLGTNYQNNLILLLTYLLASLFITIMLHSFYNFSQLTVEAKASQAGFVGEHIAFPLIIQVKKTHFDITASFVQKSNQAETVNIAECQSGANNLTLSFTSTKRGKFQLGRVKIASEYSFGLFKSWSVLDFAHQAIVYPKLESVASSQYQLTGLLDESEFEQSSIAASEGIDEFSELKTFVKGESLSRTAWKQLAKGQGHFSKHYQAMQGSLVWLKLSDMPSANIEKQLSYLCFLVCEYSNSNQTFGLMLDGSKQALKIEPACGAAHKAACLTALALY